MGKYPIYAIMALIFIGIIKLLQVTAFDADKYNKNKKASFSKPIAAKQAKSEDKKTEQLALNSSEKDSEKTPPPVLNRTENDSTEENPITETPEFEEEKPVEKKPVPRNTGTSLSSLKNNYLAPIIAKLPAGQLREDVVIRYYRHDQDGDKVYSLKELGYYIHEKEANETAGLGSNVLYYGNDVKIEDIKIVALTLLEKGLPIKALVPTRFEWKSNSIEIGTDPDLVDSSNLSASRVFSFTK